MGAGEIPGSGLRQTSHLELVRDVAESVFTLRNVSARLTVTRSSFDNVTLSFLHGAKIGVVGPNGTGKSTLLRIHGGLARAREQRRRDPRPRRHRRMLEQESRRCPRARRCWHNVEEAVPNEIQGQRPVQRISEKLATPTADYDRLLAEMGDLQTETLDHAGAWTSTVASTRPWTRLRCPPPEVLVDNLSGGERVGSRCADALPPAAATLLLLRQDRRTTSTPSRCSG